MVDHLLKVAILPVDLGPHLSGGGPNVAALLPGLEEARKKIVKICNGECTES